MRRKIYGRDLRFVKKSKNLFLKKRTNRIVARVWKRNAKSASEKTDAGANGLNAAESRFAFSRCKNTRADSNVVAVKTGESSAPVQKIAPLSMSENEKSFAHGANSTRRKVKNPWRIVFRKGIG